jgi:hypothetical protein
MKESQKFELVVKEILEEDLKDLSRYIGVKISRNRKIIGVASGHKHQIDIVVEFKFSKFKIVVLVECKKYGRKVGIDDVLEFAARIRDIGAHKGVIVSTSGFQEGALKIAHAHGIALVMVGQFGISEDRFSFFSVCESPQATIERHSAFTRALKTYIREIIGSGKVVKHLEIVDDPISMFGFFFENYKSWNPDEATWAEVYGARNPCFAFLGKSTVIFTNSHGFFGVLVLEILNKWPD